MSAQEPIYWNSYEPPRTHVLALVQMPEHKITGRALADAVMRDWYAARRALQEERG